MATPVIDTDLLWGISIFFLALALLYLISIFIIRNNISSKSLLTKQRKLELSSMVSEFLFYDDNAIVSEKSHYIGLKIEIRELLKDDFTRRVLTEILLDLRKDVSGETQKNLLALYRELGLEKDAFTKMESWRWEVVSKGILELTTMEVEEAYTFIVKFINHRKGTIRKQAEIATVTLKHEGINYFLDTTKYKISEWQQLKLLDVLRNKEDFEPPRFSAWLTSTNKHVVLFALRLIKFYNQNDANTSVIELIKHKDQQVRRQAIDCIKEFYVTEALPTLKGVFWKCTLDTKIAILGAISELGGLEDIEFLQAVSQSEGNFAAKSKAIGAINAIVPESVMPTENIEPITDYELPIPSNKAEVVDKEALVSVAINEAQIISNHAVKSARDIIVEPESNVILDTELAHPEVIVSEKDIEENSTKLNSKKHNINSDGKKPPEADEILSTTPINLNKPIYIFPKLDLMPEEIPNEEALRKIEVFSEEVNADNDEGNTLSDSSPFDISKIEFSPILTGESINHEAATCENIADKYETVPNTEEAQKELISELLDDELQALVDEIKELDFLPIVTDTQSNPKVKIDATENNEPNESLQSIEGFSLSDLEVDFETANTLADDKEEEIPGFNLEEEPIANTDFKDAMAWQLTDNELRNIECTYEILKFSSDAEILNYSIPEPVYYDEHETYMMSLLDDLEEMGDQREIPLLQELMSEENKAFIINRIMGMIEKFAQTPIVKIKANTSKSEKIELPVFSVFADLFKNIDTESKLILLDEVIHVGDEKEIEFLDGLLENADEDIRKKAQDVLILLIAKLSHEKPEAIYSNGVSAIVSEYVKPNNVETTSETKKYENLLSEMDIAANLSPEMLDIDFELSEILDQQYDQKILDIQVISNEVSPNENGGSFLKSLLNFTKLF